MIITAEIKNFIEAKTKAKCE